MDSATMISQPNNLISLDVGDDTLRKNVLSFLKSSGEIDSRKRDEFCYLLAFLRKQDLGFVRFRCRWHESPDFLLEVESLSLTIGIELASIHRNAGTSHTKNAIKVANYKETFCSKVRRYLSESDIPNAFVSLHIHEQILLRKNFNEVSHEAEKIAQFVTRKVSSHEFDRYATAEVAELYDAGVRMVGRLFVKMHSSLEVVCGYGGAIGALDYSDIEQTLVEKESKVPSYRMKMEESATFAHTKLMLLLHTMSNSESGLIEGASVDGLAAEAGQRRGFDSIYVMGGFEGRVVQLDTTR